MTDKQFKEFMKKVDKVFEQKFADFEIRLKDSLEPRFQDLEGKIDWIISALDKDENERLALGFNFDRRHADHERRILALEKASL